MSNRGRHKKKPTKYPHTWLTNVLTEYELDLIFKRAREQGNLISLANIESHFSSSCVMIWDNTPEKWEFWNDINERIKAYKYRDRR